MRVVGREEGNKVVIIIIEAILCCLVFTFCLTIRNDFSAANDQRMRDYIFSKDAEDVLLVNWNSFCYGESEFVIYVRQRRKSPYSLASRSQELWRKLLMRN